MRGGSDQRVGDVARFERFVGAAIGEEAAFAVRIDERDQPPRLAIRIADEMRPNADFVEARRFAFDGQRPRRGRRNRRPRRSGRATPPDWPPSRRAESRSTRAGPSRARPALPVRTITSIITSPMTRMREARKIIWIPASASRTVRGQRYRKRDRLSLRCGGEKSYGVSVRLSLAPPLGRLQIASAADIHEGWQ